MACQIQSFTLSDRRIIIYAPDGPGPYSCVYLCGGDMTDRLAELINGLPSLLLVSADAEWERDYTPWPAPGLPDRAPFLGGAAAHLEFLEKTVKPYIKSQFPVLPAASQSALMGYSLGGLFALWSAYHSDSFGLVASLSGSLWYDGWIQYCRSHSPCAPKKFYLSLGKAEEFSGPPQMRSVGNHTRETGQILEKMDTPDHVTLEWNRGGHFTGITNRWKRALLWAANHFPEE